MTADGAADFVGLAPDTNAKGLVEESVITLPRR